MTPGHGHGIILHYTRGNGNTKLTVPTRTVAGLDQRLEIRQHGLTLLPHITASWSVSFENYRGEPGGLVPRTRARHATVR